MEILANYTNMQRTIGLKNDAQKVTKKIEEKDKNKKIKIKYWRCGNVS